MSALATPALVSPPATYEYQASSKEGSLVVPIKYVPALSAYVVSYTVGGSRFVAIVDTGSPFLLVPSYCDETKYGCYKQDSSLPSGLAPTYERFDSNEGMVEWRRAPFSFLRQDDIPAGSMAAEKRLFPDSVTFGVLAESLMDGPGGIFLGLVKNTDARIRPSFLSQSAVGAFSIDLRARAEPKTLTLSKSNDAWISGDWIQLNAKNLQNCGDPTRHYSAEALDVSVNGRPLVASDSRGKRQKKIYVIIDTGCSGMIITPDLFDERYKVARANREKSLWGDVDVTFGTARGGTLTLSATKPLTTPFGSNRPWGKPLDGHLLVVGLAFLDNKKTSVDIDNGRMWIEA